VYKLLEAMAWEIGRTDDAELEARFRGPVAQAALFERRGHGILRDIELGRAYDQHDVPVREATVPRGHGSTSGPRSGTRAASGRSGVSTRARCGQTGCISRRRPASSLEDNTFGRSLREVLAGV
jgi:hypothetical protein